MAARRAVPRARPCRGWRCTPRGWPCQPDQARTGCGASRPRSLRTSRRCCTGWTRTGRWWPILLLGLVDQRLEQPRIQRVGIGEELRVLFVGQLLFLLPVAIENRALA